MGKERTVKDEELEKISGAGSLGSINVSPGGTAGTKSGGDATFSEALKADNEVLPGDGGKSPKSNPDPGSTEL